MFKKLIEANALTEGMPDTEIKDASMALGKGENALSSAPAMDISLISPDMKASMRPW